MESFAFLYRRVLFVGLDTVTNEADAARREAKLAENSDWIAANVEAYRGNVNAILLTGYGRLLAQENLSFYESMVRRSKEEWADKLVVYARRSAQADIDKNVRSSSSGLGPSVSTVWIMSSFFMVSAFVV